ncbi:hypothetical protein MTR67_052018 [Solanum verrucosum]|uniref:CBS domain containing protein n=1 Tax=Solanum verrucosum TaxID=315347 RepID=A0AAF0V8I7_SOLVR|nr:hypothetical protein MTR67_052018 [Solanum verrucosum]
MCKLDIGKAYDHLNWDFLINTLRQMGFGPTWLKWIEFCIKTTRFSIMVNGELVGFFPTEREIVALKFQLLQGNSSYFQVMTSNPECATLETTILEALHIMHDGKFLHLPIIDRDGCVAACIDVLQITHAAISMVENSSGAVNEMANTMMQKFWDSALNLEPPDDYDTLSEMSMSQLMMSEGAEAGKSGYPSLGLGNTFAFKFVDLKGRVNRFNFGSESLLELVTAVMQRLGAVDEQNRPQLLYEDDEGDKVLLTTDSDLVGAVSHARSLGLKVLRLHLDYSDVKSVQELSSTCVEKDGWGSVRMGIFAGAVVLTSVGVLAYLKRTNTW